MAPGEMKFVSEAQFKDNPYLMKMYGGDYTKFLSAYTVALEKLQKGSIIDFMKSGMSVPLDSNTIWREQHAKYMANFEQKYQESQLAQAAATDAKEAHARAESEYNSKLNAYIASLQKRNKPTDYISSTIKDSFKGEVNLTNLSNNLSDALIAESLAMGAASDAAFTKWVG